jgi:hypothetical protein
MHDERGFCPVERSVMTRSAGVTDAAAVSGLRLVAIRPAVQTMSNTISKRIVNGRMTQRALNTHGCDASSSIEETGDAYKCV